MRNLGKHLAWGLWTLVFFVIALVLVLTLGEHRYGDVNEGRNSWEIYPLREEYAKYVQRTGIGLAILLGIAGCLLTIGLGLLISLIILFPIAHLTPSFSSIRFPKCAPPETHTAQVSGS